VGATRQGFFSSSDLTLESEATGAVRVTVSRERINRLWANEGKRRRERQCAEDFLAALVLSGGTLT
jgi:hypothetical protein